MELQADGRLSAGVGMEKGVVVDITWRRRNRLAFWRFG